MRSAKRFRWPIACSVTVIAVKRNDIASLVCELIASPPYSDNVAISAAQGALLVLNITFGTVLLMEACNILLTLMELIPKAYMAIRFFIEIGGFAYPLHRQIFIFSLSI